MGDFREEEARQSLQPHLPPHRLHCPGSLCVDARPKCSDVDLKRIGDGSLLTARDRQSNEQVDLQAKSAVTEHRVPNRIRLDYHAEEERAAQLAMWVGRVTHAANHQETQPHRDSEASRVTAEASKRRRAAAKAAAAVDTPLPLPRIVFARPVALGGHSLIRDGQGWRCTTCKKASAKWKTLAPAQV